MTAALVPWLKVRLPGGESYGRIKAVSRERGLHTVCEEARCPNIAECWGGGTATFMILGDECTRGCRFCAVASAARPGLPDEAEPENLGRTLAGMGLDYAVITTVCRDDLPDQGAGHIARCLDAARRLSPATKIELLVQDFRGEREPLETVLAASPDVLSHNIETVERLSPRVRDARAGYGQSLALLRRAKDLSSKTPTKSSLMLGLGETEEEVVDALRDLREAGVSIVTLGQYLRPTRSPRHLPVERYVEPAVFRRHESTARKMGFLFVASGPFVRSSYRAGELFIKGLLS
jgi:lipoic acid synthetase